MTDIDNTSTSTPKTQLDIQEEILQKISGMSADQLSALSVIVDQMKDSNSTLVAIKEGLEGATIYKDKIVYVPKEVIKYVPKKVIVPKEAAELAEELKNLQLVKKYYLETIDVCDDLLIKLEPWMNCAGIPYSSEYHDFILQKHNKTLPPYTSGLFGPGYKVFDPFNNYRVVY